MTGVQTCALPISKVEIIALSLIKLNQLSDYICFLDTGYSKEETKEILLKMYPRIDFKIQYLTVILLKKIDSPQPKQETLFT